MLQHDVNADVYRAEVDHRLEHIGTFLRDFVQGTPSSVVVPLWNLRALQDESRQAGHRDLATLCEWMEAKIVALQTGQCRNSEDLAEEIRRAGEHIRQRAHDDAVSSEDAGIPKPEMKARIA